MAHIDVRVGTELDEGGDIVVAWSMEDSQG